MRKWEPWLLLAPGLALYAIFGIAPIIMTAVGSVVGMGAYSEGWIGLKAWGEVLGSARFWKSIGTTMKFVVVLLPITTALVVVLSVVLSWARGKLRSFGRFAFYVPCVVSAMMISVIWRWALAPNGAINNLFGTELLFLGTNPAAFWSICAMVVSTGLGAPIIYLMASFAVVDPEVHEAARLDGCNRAQEAWYVTLPAIAPVLMYLMVVRLSGLAQIWQFPYSMTGGGPNYGTNTLMLMTYQEAFIHTRFAHASVMSLVMVVLVGGLLMLSRVITGQRILS